MDKLEFSFFSDFQNSCSQPMQNPNQICSGILTEDDSRKVKINPIFEEKKITLYSFDIRPVVVLVVTKQCFLLILLIIYCILLLRR